MSVTTEYLKLRGIPFERIPHRRTFAALEEAGVVGAPPETVLKTLVIHCRDGYAVLVLPATHRVDMRSVREAVGDHHARLAGEEEIERAISGYELGAIPPLGSLVGARTFVDPEVFLHDAVVFAGGSQTESIRCRTEDLFRSEPINVVPLTEVGIVERELIG